MTSNIFWNPQTKPQTYWVRLLGLYMVERFSDNFSKKFNCSHKCPTIWNELEIDSNNFLCDWTYTHVCYQNLPSTRNPLWARCEMWHVVCNFWCGKFQARRRVVLRFHTGFRRGEGVFLTQGLSNNQAIGASSCNLMPIFLTSPVLRWTHMNLIQMASLEPCTSFWCHRMVEHIPESSQTQKIPGIVW